MENKELENKAPEALNDDALDTVAGGIDSMKACASPLTASILNGVKATANASAAGVFTLPKD